MNVNWCSIGIATWIKTYTRRHSVRRIETYTRIYSQSIHVYTVKVVGMA